jgi:hypothetical protein
MPSDAPVPKLDRTLRELGSDIPPDDVLARRRARVRLMSMIEGSAQAGRRRVGVTAAAAVLALALVGTSFVWISFGLGEHRAAAATLDALAAAAESRPAQAVPEGWYVHTSSEGTLLLTGQDLDSGSGWRVLVPVYRESWIAKDGSGRLIETVGKPSFVRAADRNAWERAGAPELEGTEATTRERYGPGGLFFLDARDVPQEAEDLLAAVEARQLVPGPAGDATSLRIIASLLRDAFLMPAQRAAAFEAASKLASITSLGDVIDHAGRTGVAIAATDEQGDVELVFDPDTALLLEERYIEATDRSIRTWITYTGFDVTPSQDMP